MKFSKNVSLPQPARIGLGRGLEEHGPKIYGVVSLNNWNLACVLRGVRRVEYNRQFRYGESVLKLY